jgi:hypothetical protein
MLTMSLGVVEFLLSLERILHHLLTLIHPQGMVLNAVKGQGLLVFILSSP